MKGYLLDTNAVSGWFNQLPDFDATIAALPPDTPLRIAAITKGEIEFGDAVDSSRSRNPARRMEYLQWVDDNLPQPLPVTKHVANTYGEIRAALFQRWPPKGKSQNHVEHCYDVASSSHLDLDENDVWIAATAITYNLVLVTRDSDFAKYLRPASNSCLDVVCWEI